MAAQDSTTPAGLTEEEHAAFQAAALETKDKLEKARTSPACSKWLNTSLHSEQGTAQVFEMLDAHVQTETFSSTLLTAKQHAEAHYWQAAGLCMQMAEVEQQWSHLTTAPEPVQADMSNDKDLADYVVVQREEVIEAMGAFVAAYLANLPETQKMDPQQLQLALQHALKQLRKSQVRRLWDWGTTLYRAAVVPYAAFSMYNNPWLVAALLKAVWAAAKLLGSVL